VGGRSSSVVQLVSINAMYLLHLPFSAMWYIMCKLELDAMTPYLVTKIKKYLFYELNYIYCPSFYGASFVELGTI
jgi:hypothetical protein